MYKNVANYADDFVLVALHTKTLLRRQRVKPSLHPFSTSCVSMTPRTEPEPEPQWVTRTCRWKQRHLGKPLRCDWEVFTHQVVSIERKITAVTRQRGHMTRWLTKKKRGAFWLDGGRRAILQPYKTKQLNKMWCWSNSWNYSWNVAFILKRHWRKHICVIFERATNKTITDT